MVKPSFIPATMVVTVRDNLSGGSTHTVRINYKECEFCGATVMNEGPLAWEKHAQWHHDIAVDLAVNTDCVKALDEVTKEILTEQNKLPRMR